jgi:uncharacterized membrane protein
VGNGYYSRFSLPMMGGEVLVAALLIAGVILAALFAVRRTRPAPVASGTDARAILDGRLACGEIDEQESQCRASLLSHA